jgi:hypothetical protein
MTESFGMMDGAFFVGKNELLRWVNGTYKLNMGKIEQACTGALYCQIIDSIHPGKVKMHKINWKAKLEHEYIQNFKILQQAFTDCKISKNIEVEKLIKGKYQDNLEFLQWMKRYAEERTIAMDYDPISRRGNQDLESNENVNTANIKKRDNSKPQSNTLKSVKSSKNLDKIIEGKLYLISVTNNQNNLTSKTYASINNISKIQTTNNSNSLENTDQLNQVQEKPIEINENIENKDDTEKLKEATDSVRQFYQEKIDILNDELNKCKLEVLTLKMSISQVGNQRDFYYSKLRDIEMLLQKNPNLSQDEMSKIIGNILFSEKEVELIFDQEGVHIKNR